MSKLVFAFSCFAVLFAIVATAWWVWNVFFVEYNFLFDFVFTLFASPVNAGVLVVGVIPGGILYLRTRERMDLASLLLSGSSFLVVLAEIVLVWMVPLHGA